MGILGKKAVHRLTGFKGIITGIITDIYEPDKFGISAQRFEKMKGRHTYWYDEKEVHIIDEEDEDEEVQANKIISDEQHKRNVNQIERRSAQENRVENFLFRLLGDSRKNLLVAFRRRDEVERRDFKLETKVTRSGSSDVHLVLVEPESDENLDKWGEAIIKAEVLLGIIEKEQLHEISNPNFFKAMQAKYLFRYGKDESRNG